MLIYIEMCQLCVIWAESLDSVTVSESVYVQLSIQCHLSGGDTNDTNISICYEHMQHCTLGEYFNSNSLDISICTVGVAEIGPGILLVITRKFLEINEYLVCRAIL